jgi:MFS family permease
VLGVAAATLAPSTLSLIRNMFLDPKERTRAIGVWVASFSLGAAIGPVFKAVAVLVLPGAAAAKRGRTRSCRTWC